MESQERRFVVVDQKTITGLWTKSNSERYVVVDLDEDEAIKAIADTREKAETSADRLNRRPPDVDPRDLPGVTRT